MYPRPSHMVVAQGGYSPPPPPPPPPPPLDVTISPTTSPGTPGLEFRNNGTGGTHSNVTSVSYTATINDHGTPGVYAINWGMSPGPNGGAIFSNQSGLVTTFTFDVKDNDDFSTTGNVLVYDTNYPGTSRNAGDNVWKRWISA